MSEEKLRVKTKNLRYFDAELCFSLLASLRSAIFSKILVDNYLPKINYCYFYKK